MDNISILLVEDNKLNQRLMESSLKRFGFKIDLANNGLEAVEKYQANHKNYDLIIMDIMMPVMDGFHAFDEIRKKNKNVPIIAVTARALPNEKRKIIEYGFNDYISKPIEDSVLLKKIKNYLNEN